MKAKKSLVKLIAAGIALGVVTLLSSCTATSSDDQASRHVGGQHGGQHR